MENRRSTNSEAWLQIAQAPRSLPSWLVDLKTQCIFIVYERNKCIRDFIFSFGGLNFLHSFGLYLRYESVIDFFFFFWLCQWITFYINFKAVQSFYVDLKEAIV